MAPERQAIQQALAHARRIDETLIQPLAALKDVIEEADRWLALHEQREARKAQLDKDLESLTAKKDRLTNELERHRTLVLEEHTHLTRQAEEARTTFANEMAQERKKVELVQQETREVVAHLQQMKRDLETEKGELHRVKTELQSVVARVTR